MDVRTLQLVDTWRKYLPRRSKADSPYFCFISWYNNPGEIMQSIHVIGAGLAGVEAAYYLAKKGIQVDLYEMRPVAKTPAHHSDFFAELVCSNSLKSKQLDNACGLLKSEMTALGSLMMETALKTEVPAGNALSVDRDAFASTITDIIKNHPLIRIHYGEVTTLPEGICILATGPLTSTGLSKTIQSLIGEEFLSFFDASAPIVEKSSINMDIAYIKSRYEQDSGSYINCAMDQEQYFKFYQELIQAKLAPVHDFDTDYFSGCMPVEVMAKKGIDTLRYGPLKPKGLRRDENHRPYAVVQLRQDNAIGSLYNLVGFQTNLTYGEQKRVFRLIPGLENAEFIRYGLMHRNSYVCAPKVLNPFLQIKSHPHLFIAGQLSGVEGYVESAATGIFAGINAERLLKGLPLTEAPFSTILGSLIHYITHTSVESFAPMNANFGIVYGANKHHRDQTIEASQKAMQNWLKALYESDPR